MSVLIITIQDIGDEVDVRCAGDTEGERTPAWVLANKTMKFIQTELTENGKGGKAADKMKGD